MCLFFQLQGLDAELFLTFLYVYELRCCYHFKRTVVAYFDSTFNENFAQFIVIWKLRSDQV